MLMSSWPSTWRVSLAGLTGPLASRRRDWPALSSRQCVLRHGSHAKPVSDRSVTTAGLPATQPRAAGSARGLRKSCLRWAWNMTSGSATTTPGRGWPQTSKPQVWCFGHHALSNLKTTSYRVKCVTCARWSHGSAWASACWVRRPMCSTPWRCALASLHRRRLGQLRDGRKCSRLLRPLRALFVINMIMSALPLCGCCSARVSRMRLIMTSGWFLPHGHGSTARTH